MAKYLITKGVNLTLLVPRRILPNGLPYGLCWAECGFDIDDINAPDGALQGNDSYDGVAGEFDGDDCQMVRFVDDSKFVVTQAMQDKITQLYPNGSHSVVDETHQDYIDMKADILQARTDSQA